MKAIPIKELRANDYPEQKGWISKLCYDVNDSLRSIVLAITGNLTFSENMRAIVRDVPVTGAASYALQIAWPHREPPSAVWAVQTTTDPPSVGGASGAVWVNWSWRSPNVVIDNITGLTSGTRYLVRLVIMKV